jgi:hypothetical protein
MNRHERRANNRRDPSAAALASALRCPDCHSHAVIVQVASRRYESDIFHAPTCPWLAQLERALAADRAAREGGQ